MLYIALAELLIIALLIGLFAVRERDHESVVERSYGAWERERAELLTRIQRPEYIPQSMQPAALPPLHVDVDEFERVGKILDFEPEEQQS